MLAEIDKDFYCSANCYQAELGNCSVCFCGCQTCKKDCENYHRKHPTPSQFKEEYGEEYPDDGALWERLKAIMNAGTLGIWRLVEYRYCRGNHTTNEYVCACTPFGMPPKDWRPE
jgi:hypothetical protein